ncbi:MAG: CHAD domain-containing protein [Nitrospiraceae bacterium]
MPAEDDRAARYQTVALHALAKLSAGAVRPKTVHRLRTHLRRLQAYLELVGEDRNAEIMANCASRLSSFRTLQVFERYLTRLRAAPSDIGKVKDRIRKKRVKLDRAQVYLKIERRVRRHALPPTPASPDWMADRMEKLRREHVKRLHELISEAIANPRRKTLHALRLKIKPIRYQEEWALDQAYARPEIVSRLKRAQSVLGDYEERAQFRKLARTLHLKSSAKILKDWRRAKTRARTLPTKLTDIVSALAGSGLRLVESALPPNYSPIQGPRRATAR